MEEWSWYWLRENGKVRFCGEDEECDSDYVYLFLRYLYGDGE